MLARITERPFARNSFFFFFFNRFSRISFFFFSSPKVGTARGHELFYFLARIGIRSRAGRRSAAAVGNKTLPSSGAILEEPLKIATPRHVSTNRLPTISSSQRTLSAKFAAILVRQQSAKLHPHCPFSHFKREKYFLKLRKCN